MTDKELRKMNRRELLEILVAQGQEIERLQAALEDAEARANDREIRIKEAGSIAVAALQINGVYHAAEAAAKQYLDNVRRMDAEAQQERDALLAQVQQDAQQIMDQAEEQRQRAQRDADQYWLLVSQKLESFYKEHQGLKELLAIDTRRSKGTSE